MVKIYDVIIIGAGPAGLTAGLYAVRNGLKTGIISKDIGGTANSILLLENWPGFKGTGAELMKKFYEQLQKYKIDFMVQEVKLIEKIKNYFIVNRKIKCKTIILATGTQRKKLNLPKEKKFIGKGVSYCVTCDSFFFKGKTVGIVGGSGGATASALVLSGIAKKVYVFYRGEKLRCEKINAEKLNKKKNVEIHYNSFPIKIIGKNKVEGMEILERKTKKMFKLDGIFIEIGAEPLTNFAKKLKLKLDKENRIIVDENMETSAKGVFAAGDITHHKLKQVIVASGQGAIAAKSAGDFLRK